MMAAVAAHWRAHRRGLQVIAAVSVVMGLLTSVAIVMFLLDSLQLLQTVVDSAVQMFKLGAAKATFKLVVYAATLLFLGYASWRAVPRAQEQRETPGLIGDR
jgi:hypothetical protein